VNVGIKGMQDAGKTSLAVKAIVWHIEHNGFAPQEVESTVEIRIPGVKFLYVDKALNALDRMVAPESYHKILFLDEADSYLGHRDWEDKKQYKRLKGLWQDQKRFNWCYWTSHVGNGVDKMLREMTEIILMPKYYKALDASLTGFINKMDMEDGQIWFPNISYIFDKYSRHAPVW